MLSWDAVNVKYIKMMKNDMAHVHNLHLYMHYKATAAYPVFWFRAHLPTLFSYIWLQTEFGSATILSSPPFLPPYIHTWGLSSKYRQRRLHLSLCLTHTQTVRCMQVLCSTLLVQAKRLSRVPRKAKNRDPEDKARPRAQNKIGFKLKGPVDH